MSAILTIVGKDLKQRIRDKSFFIWGVITPLFLAFVFNMIFGGVMDGLEVRVGYVDEDRSEVTEQLSQFLGLIESQGVIELIELDSADDPAAAVQADDLSALVVIPAGFGEAAMSADGTPSLTITDNVDRETRAGIVHSLINGFAQQFDRTRISITAASALGVEPPSLGFAQDVVVNQQGTSTMNPATMLTAGMAAFFLLFTVQFGVTGLLEERREGTMYRLMGAPIRRSAIVVAKGLVSFGLGVLSTGLLLFASTLLLGADFGSPLGVAVLVLAGVLTATSIMGIVAGLARTPEGASNVQSIIAVVLGLLGGSFFRIGGGPIMEALTRATPHYWFLEGIEALAGGASWTAALPAAGILLLIALVVGIPASILLRRPVRI